MSIISKLHHIRYMVAASLLLPLVCACSSEDNGDGMAEPQLASSNQYINLSIVVSSGSEGTMRGTPAGGENGDGREAGSERENLVTGVTVMLYEDAAGINTSAETTLAFCKYYPVSLVSRETAGTPYATKTDEAVYSTGDQPLVGSGLDMSKEYRAIVVANQNMASTFTTASKVKDVRDYVTTHVYSGSGLGADASHFVMSLETDYTVNFASPSSKTTVGNKTTYHFDGIRIERLAARVDFWTNNATYATNDGATPTPHNYAAPGYVYPVWKTTDTTPTSDDRFVLTAVTPFNIYTDGEYLFKRTDDTTIPYLADESTTNYVIDPQRSTKTAASPTYYNNTLASLLTLDETYSTLANATGYYQSMETLHGSTTQKAGFNDDGGKDNFILCYPKENTLLPASPLYYYATGVAIEGYYYVNNDASQTPTRYIYYGYLRHQGESDGPYTIKQRAEMLTTETSSSTAMNYGVVRNNIYRISIDKINEKGTLELSIKVKKWDTFTHSWIYM